MTRAPSATAGRATTPAPRANRGRPRSEASRVAILNVSLKLLERDGYKALTMEKIARAAGVGKQTIYRWWRSKAEVVLEAFTAYAETEVPTPDTGAFRSDIERLIRNIVRGFGQVSAPTVRALMAETLIDSEFRKAFGEIFVARRQTVLLAILHRAIKRSEISEHTDVRTAMDLVYGALWHRFLHETGPMNRNFADRLADFVVDGVAG